MIHGIASDQGYWGGSGGVSLSYVTSNTDATNASSYTFTAQSIGTAAADRQIIILVGSRQNTNGITVSSVTVAGISASKDIGATATTGSTATDVAEIWRASVSSGTTGDVVVTFSSTMLRCAIGIYRLTGAQSGAAYSTGSSNTGGSPMSTTVNLAAGGCAIAAGWNEGSGTSTISWTNVTQDFNVQPESTTNALVGASTTSSSAQSGYSVSGVYNGSPVTNGISLAVASYSP